MPVRDPTRLTRVETVLGGIFEAHFGADVAVVWADQPAPRRPLPVLELKLTSPPRALHHPIRQRATLPRVVDVVFDTVDAGGEDRMLFVNGRRHLATATTPAAMVAAMLAAFADSPEPVTVTEEATDTIRVTANGVGDLESIRVAPAGDHTTLLLVDNEDVEIKRIRKRAVLSIDVHSALPIGASSAKVILDDAIELLTDSATLTTLREERIGVTSIASPRDLSAVQGTAVEARAQTDVGLLLQSRIATPCPSIETVEATQQLAGETTITINIP